ncbi:acyl-CoA dehydrogenase family protein [Paenibacillus sp. YSY-4.3]
MSINPFTHEHESYRNGLRQFLDQEIRPHLSEWRTAGHPPPIKNILRKLGEAGYLSATFPEQYGGAALNYWYNVILHEELARLPNGAIGMSVASHLDIATSLVAKYAHKELAAEWVPSAIQGESLLALALTEENAGSDLNSVLTTAVQEGDGYVLQGRKTFISNGVSADAYCVLAKTANKQGDHALTLFFVPKSSLGVAVVRNLPTLGNQGDIAEIEFDRVKVTQQQIIGGLGFGLFIQMKQFFQERTIIAIRMAAMARYHVDLSIEHSKKRRTFGKPLSSNQHVQFTLAQLITEIELVKQFSYGCIRKMSTPNENMADAAMAKYAGGKLVRKVADQCLQLFGGEGYLDDHPISLFFRDARALSLAGGTDEMMLNMIARVEC